MPVLIVSILLVTMVYLLINMAFLNVLGLNGMAATETVGVEMMRATLGDKGVVLIGVIISLSAITSMNTTIFTGAFTRSGFEAMVEFTAPVFWFFFLSAALSLIVMRKKNPDRPRPFRVPLYPLTPLLFTGFCGYMFFSSLTVTGPGSLLGIALMFVGYIVSLLISKKEV